MTPSAVLVTLRGKRAGNAITAPFTPWMRALLKEADRTQAAVLQTLDPEGDQSSEKVDLIPHTLNQA